MHNRFHLMQFKFYANYYRKIMNIFNLFSLPKLVMILKHFLSTLQQFDISYKIKCQSIKSRSNFPSPRHASQDSVQQERLLNSLSLFSIPTPSLSIISSSSPSSLSAHQKEYSCLILTLLSASSSEHLKLQSLLEQQYYKSKEKISEFYVLVQQESIPISIRIQQTQISAMFQLANQFRKR